MIAKWMTEQKRRTETTNNEGARSVGNYIGDEKVTSYRQFGICVLDASASRLFSSWGSHAAHGELTASNGFEVNSAPNKIIGILNLC